MGSGLSACWESRFIGGRERFDLADLYTIFSNCERDHVEYNLAYIPPNFDGPHKADFDTAYMQALFAAGERMAVKGEDWWYEHPPVLLSGVNEEQQEY